jgi:hypothetical protein
VITVWYKPVLFIRKSGLKGLTLAISSESPDVVMQCHLVISSVIYKKC